MENPGEIIFRLLSSWVNSPGIQEMLFFPKLVLMPLGIFFLLFVIFASFKSSWFYYLVLVDAKEWFTFRAFGLRRMASKWQQALSRLETVNEAEYKLAIIEADAMIDEALKRLGFGG
ncbi:MAG: hypothetical protein Q8P03_00275, partial [bacterium]|nr:hypothetical protein [bacterium]